jgi:16S rRNA (cytosine967-C5)-methyltransferase
MNIRLEAYKIITKVLLKDVYSDKLLKQLQKSNSSNSSEVEYVYLLVKGVIKLKQHLDFIAVQYTDVEKFKKTDDKIKILIYLGLYELLYVNSTPSHAVINETVEIAKSLFDSKIANFINAVLREHLRNPTIIYPEQTFERLAYQYSFPKELIETWLKLWGEETTEFLCLYFNENPNLSIRVNRIATSPEKLTEYFQRRNVYLEKSELSSMILLSNQANHVLHDVAFSEGYFSVQDAAAALVVELMNPQPKDVILDLFAAPGGKTAYIAETMNDIGEIFAVDKIPARIKMLKQNIDRLQLTCVKEFCQDAFQFGPVTPSFDQVLLDVPCSGWGVMQKKAELRWQNHQDIPELIKLQAKALKHGSMFVKDCGYLIYSTCTMNPQENELQIEHFLEKNKEFKLISANHTVNTQYVKKGFLHIMPFEHNSDGVFAAKMQRIVE